MLLGSHSVLLARTLLVVAVAVLAAIIGFGTGFGVSGVGVYGVSDAYASTGFGIERYALTATEQGGSPDARAGSHPYDLTAEVALDPSADSLRDLQFELPPGIVLDGRTVASPCTLASFMGNACPNETAVGVAMVSASGKTHPAALYAVEPEPGESVRLGFSVEGFPQFVEVALRPGGNGMTLSLDAVSQIMTPTAIELTLWGDPTDPSHDALRGKCATGEETSCPGSGTGAPFVTLPTSCAGPSRSTAFADSWQTQGKWQSDPVSFPQLTDCQRLPFAPALRVVSSSAQPGWPAGYDVDLSVPQQQEPAGLATAQLENASVTLPAGASLSLAGTNGLSGCSTAEFAADSSEPVMCPNESKVGQIKIVTPLLAQPLEGAVYLATPNANPLGALVVLDLLAREPDSGVTLKLTASLSLNPTTGQPTLSFDELPQLPIEELDLRFFDGEGALLANPQACGPATSVGRLTPWSATEEAAVSSTFEVGADVGDGDGACASPLPFAPALRVEPASVPAGDYGQLVMAISHEYGQQDLAGFSLGLPTGMQWLLSSVPLCGESEASDGACAPASEIGTAIMRFGPAPSRAWFTGTVYLTGGYGGGQYGLSIALDATAGPFDFGEMVLRAAIDVNPVTGALTIASDPLTRLIDGIPLRTVAFEMAIDRSDFILNPTLCESRQFAATIEGSEGTSMQASEPFMVEDCRQAPSTGPPNTGAHTASPRKSHHESPIAIADVHERLLGHRLLLLTFKTSTGGIVTITGPGVLSYKHRIRAGAHRARLTLTKRGLFDIRHHRRLELRLVLHTSGGGLVGAKKVVAFTPGG